MATSLLTSKFSTYLATQVQEAIEEPSNTAFYVYTGVHGDVIGDIPLPANDERELIVDAYHNMVFGKRVAAHDVSLLVRNIPWEGGKVFEMYDDDNPNLLDSDFYCQVDEGAYIHCYKCLRNFFDAESTVEPAYSYVDENSNYIFETSDGYIWKYMYSISSTVRDKFATQIYFPVTDNANVQANAIRGAVDVIRIEQTDLEIPGGGRGYHNYTAGTFATNQLRINGNNVLYAISNDSISYEAGFYTGCLLYISGGSGAGQYSTVIDYFHNSNGNFIVLEDDFPLAPQNGTTWELYPEVVVTGSGKETVTAIARGLVNATGSNSIYKVEILERGAGYDYISANAVANGVIKDDVSFIEVELHPIYSPADGHGSDAAAELGAQYIEFSVRFANSESNTLLTENRYQQVGLLKDPSFANVGLEITNTAMIFLPGESVFKIDPVRINSNVNISNTSAVITGEASVLSNVAIVTSGATGSYIPEDVMDIEGGTSLRVAQVQVVKTNVRQASISNNGTGYTPGTFSANLNLGTTVVNAIFTVSVNSIGQCNSLIIANPGEYTANPPFLANSTPVGGAGSGLRVSLQMGLDEIDIYDQGSYSLIPTDLATNEPIANQSSGTGAELILTFESTLSSDFLNQIDIGDYVYFTNVDKTLQQIAVVNSITNATSMTIDVNGYFSCAAAHMYLPHITSSAEIVEAANTTWIRVSHVDQELGTGDLLIGATSGAKAQVGTVVRNGEEKNFDTFVQLYKYDIALLSDVFIENEYVYQGESLTNSTAKALLHSVVTSGEITYMYTSNQVGQFVSSETIQGANSLAVASINNQWSPELEFGSGDILYIENVEPVNRNPDQTETFQIVIGF